MVTSEQVARLAGVSRATVSRVLNGSSNVSDETRKRIYAAVATLGYGTNIFTQEPSLSRTQTIALALSSENGLNFTHLTDTRYYFYLKLLQDIEREAAKEGYDLLLSSLQYGTSAPVDDRETNYLLALQAKHVSGVIALALNSTDPRIQALCRSSMPAIFVDSRLEGTNTTYVKSDYMEGACLATEHLLQLGHRQIAFFPGEAISLPGTERLMGCQQTMARAGIVINPTFIRTSGWNSLDGYQAAMAFLDEHPDITAIVAGSDMLAFGIQRALLKHNLRVPEDISLIGFDDIDMSENNDPPLTTIHQDTQALSRGALVRLLQMIRGEETPSPLMVPTQLIIRDSTRPNEI